MLSCAVHGKHGIAVLDRRLDFLAVQAEDGSLDPLRQTQAHNDGMRAARADIQLQRAAMHQAAALLNADIGIAQGRLDGRADQQVDINAALIDRIDVLPEGGKRAGDIRRAAGNLEPRLPDGLEILDRCMVLAVCRPDLQRIDVEIAVARSADAAEHRVAQGALHGLVVRGIVEHGRHALAEHHQTDGRAAFAVHAVVRQVVIHGKTLEQAGRADAAGDIHTALRDIVPERLAGAAQRLVLLDIGQISHCAALVHGADRVTLHCLLLHGTHMRLGVGRIVAAQFGENDLVVRVIHLAQQVVRRAAAAVNEETSRLQVALLARHAPELHERKLDLLMAGIAGDLPLAVAEGLADEICELRGNVEQAALAGGVIVGDGGLDEVARAVELVALGEVLPAELGMADREIGVQVAVRLLGLADDLNELVSLGNILCFAVICAIGNGLEPFIGIRIAEDNAAVLALERAAGDAEIINAEAAALALLAVEDLPLHGDHFLCDHARVMAEQRIRYSNFFQIGDRDLACHNVEPPLVVKRLRRNQKRKRGIPSSVAACRSRNWRPVI